MTLINPKMLVLAREARGLSQADLVNNLKGISQATYSRMEKGIVNIQDEHLSHLSSALGFPVKFFYRSEPVVTQMEYFYRKKATMLKKEQYTLEANFSLIRLLFNEMLTEIDIPDFAIPEIEVEHSNTPIVIARKIRMFLGIQKGPIGALINILEKNGIIVYFLNDSPSKFDGTTIITKCNTKIIVVNADMPNYRKRFTIAHELGHIICHIPFINTDPYRDVEKEANLFAAEFLMPSDECMSELYKLTYSRLAEIKSYWNFSKSAIIRRAYDLGCITKDKYTHLMIELSRYNERKSEKSDVQLDQPKILSTMVDTYFNELKYSKDDLLESLAITQDDFNHFIVKQPKVHKLQIAV